MDENRNHDEMVTALLEEKSFAALVYLIDHGRELEFDFCRNTYFISKDKAAKYVSLWKGTEEQSFDSVQELIEQGKLEGETFRKAFGESEICTLF